MNNFLSLVPRSPSMRPIPEAVSFHPGALEMCLLEASSLQPKGGNLSPACYILLTFPSLPDPFLFSNSFPKSSSACGGKNWKIVEKGKGEERCSYIVFELPIQRIC